MTEPHCSNFRIITAIAGVPKFRNLWYAQSSLMIKLPWYFSRKFYLFVDNFCGKCDAFHYVQYVQICICFIYDCCHKKCHILFVCCEVKTAQVLSSRSVNLSTLFLGMLPIKRLTSTKSQYFCRRMISWPNLYERYICGRTGYQTRNLLNT